MDRRAGQAGLFVVVNLTLLFGVLGLAVDLGLAYFRREAAQAAADAAALAAGTYAKNNGYTCGSSGVVCGAATSCAYPNTTPPVTDIDIACLYAGANGFYNHGNQTVSITANTTTPPGLSNNAPAYWVQANVSETGLNMFARFGGISGLRINASAIAGITSSVPAGCIFVMSRSASLAVSITGSSSVSSSCGVFINSSASNALNVQGTSQLHATEIMINGGNYAKGASAVISPTPNTAGGTVTDPLSALPMPTVGTCDHPTTTTYSGVAIATISPGVYCGGLQIHNSAQVTMNPGTYILNGGGLTADGATILSGTHVTIFNTGQNGQTAGPVAITNGAKATLTAPNSGTYQGMLFVQDRNLSYSGTNTFSGDTTSAFTGTLYFPSTAISYQGSSSGTYTAIIANTATFTGASTIKNDPTGTITGLGSTSTAIIQ